MTQLLAIHPETPQKRLVHQVITVLDQPGSVIAYPTDSAYALGCRIGDKDGMEKIRKIRQLDEKHNFTLTCRDLSELAIYARVDNSIFRLLKAYTPGPYTFILPATKEVPRRLQHSKKKTIGIRVPENPIALAILEEMQEPLMTVTLILPGDELPLSDPAEIYDRLRGQIELVVDGGACGIEPTTVVDLVSGEPQVVRKGRGDPKPFLY